MKRTIIIEPIAKGDEINASGFDNPLEDQLFEDYDYVKDDIEQIGDYDFGYPINLQDLKEVIQEVESCGANFLSLDYHEDHGTYLIQGLKIRGVGEKELK